jgi:3',5'-cyclic AMP phosphodiesterase CpdA
MKQLNFYLVTDTHYFDTSFGASGEAYERRSRTDQKCVAETGAIIDAGFAKIASDTDTDIILIPGDLVYRGEYQSHVGFRDRLYKLKEQGKKIYLITARHDYAENVVEFIGDKEYPVKGMERDELRDFYKDFGFAQAISEHKPSMSYVVQLQEGYRLLALNCDGDCKDFKGLWNDQIQWALDEIEKAHQAGDYIFAMTHYPLLPFSPIMNLIGDAKLTDWQKLADLFADAGMNLIFTGHMHAQALTQYTSPKGNTITDIQTGCFVGCPCAYRRVTIDDENVTVKSFTIEDFDWDKGGKTASEYFQWRFDRMITDIIDAMANDFAFFTRLFGGPEKNKKLKVPVTIVGKTLQKLTLKKLGRLLCFKVDKSIQNRLVKDVGVEIVRNIFVGDEPYTKGTPMYQAVEKLLKRLHPVIKIVEKKADENSVLSDITALVLNSIGDDKKMDYNCTIPR